MIILTLDETRTKLAVHFDYNQALVERIKLFPGRVWKKPYWLLPLTVENVYEVEQGLAQYGRIVKDELVMNFLHNKQEANKEVLDWKSSYGKLELQPGTQFFTEPYEHQKTALALCQRRNSFALFMEMGTGKTKVMVDLMGNYYRDNLNGFRPSLIVGPVAVIHNWKRQAELHQPGLKLVVAHGSVSKKRYALQQVITGQAHGIIINYESLWRMEDEFERVRWWSIILDESTRIKHRGTQQAKAIIRLGQTTIRKYILTGTPAPNSPLELFNQVKFLDPTVFGTSWYAFRDRYAMMGGYGGYQVLGWKNLPELSKKLSEISFRVLKKDCLDLPPKVYQEYRLTMDDTQRKIYKELAEELVTSVKGIDIVATVVLAKLTKLRQLASGFVYSPDGQAIPLSKNPKLDQLEEMLPELCKEHKVVIWTSFKEEIKMISALCDKHNITWVKYDGSMNSTEKDDAQQGFQNSPGLKVFIGQQHSGGIGIDLFAADYCIFFSNDYSGEIRAQAEDRLHRSGQKNQVVYADLIMKGTIDAAIKRMLESKATLSASITPDQLQEILYDKEEEF